MAILGGTVSFGAVSLEEVRAILADTTDGSGGDGGLTSGPSVTANGGITLDDWDVRLLARRPPYNANSTKAAITLGDLQGKTHRYKVSIKATDRGKNIRTLLYGLYNVNFPHGMPVEIHVQEDIIATPGNYGIIMGGAFDVEFTGPGRIIGYAGVGGKGGEAFDTSYTDTGSGNTIYAGGPGKPGGTGGHAVQSFGSDMGTGTTDHCYGGAGGGGGGGTAGVWESALPKLWTAGGGGGGWGEFFSFSTSHNGGLGVSRSGIATGGTAGSVRTGGIGGTNYADNQGGSYTYTGGGTTSGGVGGDNESVDDKPSIGTYTTGIIRTTVKAGNGGDGGYFNQPGSPGTAGTLVSGTGSVVLNEGGAGGTAGQRYI